MNATWCDDCNPRPLPLVPDPTRTAAAMSERSGFHSTIGSTGARLIDDRAVASGKRRSSARVFSDARANEAHRRGRA
jgi:hypothetical protein